MAPFMQTLKEVEREHILNTLAYCRGNRIRTAKVLRISVRCLRAKLRIYKPAGCDVCATNEQNLCAPNTALKEDLTNSDTIRGS